MWDNTVAAFRMANKTSAADLKRLNKIGPDLIALRGVIQTWVKLQKETPCGQILSAANSVMDALMSAAAAVEKWAVENKCILIKVAFAAVGTLGDIALVAGLTATGAGAPIAAELAAMQAQPICLQLKAGQFKIPGTKKANLLVMGLDFLRQTACKITEEFNVKTEDLVAACAGLDVAFVFVQVVVQFYCGSPVGALCTLASAASECAAGCPNGFCPNGKVVLQLGSTDTEEMEAKTVEQVLEQARAAALLAVA
jgi:hypothetical protein